MAEHPLPVAIQRSMIMLLETTVNMWTSAHMKRLHFRLNLLEGAISPPDCRRQREIAYLKAEISEIERHRHAFCG